MTETETPATADPWAKPIVSIRLSSRRKAALLRIAARLPAGASPSAALDAAIASSLANPPDLSEPLSERFEALEDAFGAVARDMHAVAERREAASLDAARASRAVLDLISAASSGEAADAETDELGTLPISVWLTRELMRLDARGAETAIVQAKWKGMSESGEGLAKIDLDASIAAVDGRQVSAIARARRIEIEGVEMGGPLFTAVACNASRPLFLVARGNGASWRATFFSAASDGRAAERLGETSGF